MPATATDRLSGISTSTAVKPPCRAYVSASIAQSGEQTIGGVACVDGDRYVYNLSPPSVLNGIWVVRSGAHERAKDFNGNRDVTSGTLVKVNAGPDTSQLYEVTTTGAIVIGTTAIAFAPLTAGSTILADLAGTASATLGDYLLGVKLVATGAVARTQHSKNTDFINARDFGCSPSASAAVNDVAFQAAIDYCGANRLKLYVPGGTYQLSTCLDATSDSGLQHEGLTIVGDGKDSTKLNFTGAATGFETQGTDAFTLKDIAIQGDYNVGVFVARNTDRVWGGNHYYENSIIYASPKPAANGGIGSIAVLNHEGEEPKYHNCEFWGDIAYALTPPNDLSIATFDATCNYVTQLSFTYTPIYKATVATPVSNTVFHFSGGCRFISWGHDSPTVLLRSASDLDFGNSFFQKRNASGTRNPFMLDTANVFRMFSTGTHEHASHPCGAICINGTLNGSEIMAAAGYKNGATNDVPLIYVVNFVGATLAGSRFQIIPNGDADQLPLKLSTSTTWGVILQNTEFFFDGTATLATLPPNFLFNAAKTRITYGAVAGGGEEYGSVWCDTRHRKTYTISKVLAAATVTDLFEITLPPTDISSITTHFEGTLLAGWIVGAAQAYAKPGEFDAQITRQAGTAGLTATTAYARWAAGQSTDAGQLTMTDPTISYSLTGQTKVKVRMLSNTAGAAAAGVTTKLIGELTVNSSYGTNAQTAAVTVL